MQHSSFPKPDVGAGWFLGSDYEVKNSVVVEEKHEDLDMHEFNTFANGRRALVVTSGETDYWGAEVGIYHNIRSKDNGFKEIDTLTGETLFEWHCVDHMRVFESSAPIHRNTYENREGIWDPL
jgi:hypothetical protein